MDEKRVTTVEAAGRVFGLSRAAAYRAAKRGDIPTLRLGRRLVVPLPALDDLLHARLGKYLAGLVWLIGVILG
jgi:hypothetical protein